MVGHVTCNHFKRTKEGLWDKPQSSLPLSIPALLTSAVEVYVFVCVCVGRAEREGEILTD